MKYVVAIILLFSGLYAKPQSTHVNISWEVPSATSTWAGCGTGQPACSYKVYRAVASGSTCPTAYASYREITAPWAHHTATNFTDTTASGTISCYAVETAQTPKGSKLSQYSGLSNIVGPITVAGRVPLFTREGGPPSAASTSAPAAPVILVATATE